MKKGGGRNKNVRQIRILDEMALSNLPDQISICPVLRQRADAGIAINKYASFLW